MQVLVTVRSIIFRKIYRDCISKHYCECKHNGNWFKECCYAGYCIVLGYLLSILLLGRVIAGIVAVGVGEIQITICEQIKSRKREKYTMY